MSTVDDEIRERLAQVVDGLTPFARGAGPFPDLQALPAAILLAGHALERAGLLANYRLPPKR
jgi:hypothetical protein